MRKITSFAIFILSFFILTGCSFNNTGTITKIGRIDQIENNNITITIGKIRENNSDAGRDSNSAEKDSQDDLSDRPPDLPDNDTSQETSNKMKDNSEVPPDKPDGSEIPPDKPEDQNLNFENNFVASSEVITVDNYSEVDNFKIGEIVEVTLDSNNTVTNIEKYSTTTSETLNGTSSRTIDTVVEEKGVSYSTNNNDENVLRIIKGGDATFTDATIEKKGETTNSGNSNFYGLNAGILVTDGGKLVISESKVDTVGNGANGIFNYGNGSTLTATNLDIITEGDEAGGINTAGGATTTIKNSNIETQGNSSAAIRSDRGGGNITVEDGSYITNGTGSPSIYSTADINVNNAKLEAKNSEALVVEGRNSIELNNCQVIGNMSGTYSDQNENLQNIMLYQSTSGDAEEGVSSLKVTGGSITSKSGDMIYVTNTEAELYLENVDLTLSNDTLLKVSGNSSERHWGEEGKNGGNLTATFNNQKINGNIVVDDISSLDMSLDNNSEYTGTINSTQSTGNIKVKLDETSKWILTGDSYITEFEGDRSLIDTNGFSLYINGEKL